MYSNLPAAPENIGDLLGLSIRLCRRNIGEIFRFILPPSILTLVAGILLQWVFSYGTHSVNESRTLDAALSLVGVSTVAFVVFFLSWWVLGIRLLALSRFFLGFSPTLSEAQEYMRRRKWAVLGVHFTGLAILTGVLTLVAVFFVSAILIDTLLNEVGRVVVGILLGVALVPILAMSCSIYLIGSCLSLIVLSCEDISVINIISRTFVIVFRHFWRSLAFVGAFLLVFSVVSYPLSLPVAALTFVDALQYGLNHVSQAGGATGYKPPMYLLVLTQAWEAGMGFVLRPFLVIAFALFYYDLRLRSEGLDLQRKLQTPTVT